MRTLRFTATLEKHPRLDATYVEFPFSVEETFGGRGRVKVLATFDGVEYRGSLVNMGSSFGCHAIGVTQEIRKAIGKNPGDQVRVTLQNGAAPRTVEIPADLAKRFARNKKAQAFFDTLSHTNRKEFAAWITSAQREDTRTRRVQQTIEKLRARRKEPSDRH